VTTHSSEFLLLYYKEAHSSEFLLLYYKEDKGQAGLKHHENMIVILNFSFNNVCVLDSA